MTRPTARRLMFVPLLYPPRARAAIRQARFIPNVTPLDDPSPNFISRLPRLALAKELVCLQQIVYYLLIIRFLLEARIGSREIDGRDVRAGFAKGRQHDGAALIIGKARVVNNRKVKESHPEFDDIGLHACRRLLVRPDLQPDFDFLGLRMSLDHKNP